MQDKVGKNTFLSYIVYLYYIIYIFLVIYYNIIFNNIFSFIIIL